MKRRRRVRTGRPRPLRPIRLRYSRDWWQLQRRALFHRTGGHCESCGAPFDLRTMDAAHLIPLGMGHSRHDESNPLNELTNLLGVCRECHRRMERERLYRLALERARARKS